MPSTNIYIYIFIAVMMKWKVCALIMKVAIYELGWFLLQVVREKYNLKWLKQLEILLIIIQEVPTKYGVTLVVTNLSVQWHH